MIAGGTADNIGRLRTMPTGQEISVDFIRRVVWPALQREFPDESRRLAVAVIGTGSDVTGLDDEVSRDHHWGPRANVMVLPEDAGRLLPQVRESLHRILPDTFDGYPVIMDTVVMTGVCCTAIDQFFRYFLGTDELPGTDADWLTLCEVDLRHATAGVVVVDEAGELTRRRLALAYYPDHVWRKRLADWCMYITGRDAPYNLYRVAKRRDALTGAMYKALYLKQVMEFLFMLNRQYAPYTKWLNRTFRQLPRYAAEVAPMLDAIFAEGDLVRNVHQMIDVNYMLAEALAELGLTRKPVRVPFEEGLTDLTLYDSAAQIYASLPQNLLAPSFNRTELWERLARDVLFDSNDYFQKRQDGGH
jgi:hypothetical protein